MSRCNGNEVKSNARLKKAPQTPFNPRQVVRKKSVSSLNRVSAREENFFVCLCHLGSSIFFVFFSMVFSGSKERKTGYSSIDHLRIPLIVLGLRVRPTADEDGVWEMQLTTPVRLDPPLHLQDLVVGRPRDSFDPAVDDLRGVALEGEGDGLLLLLLLRGGGGLLRPVGRGTGGGLR